MLRHPLPVLLVHLGPLRPKLGAAVTGLNVALLRGVLGVRAAAGRVPPARPRRQVLALRLGAGHGARRHLLRGHEREQSDEDGRDLPGRVEGPRMEVGDGEAQPCRRLEATGGRVHPDSGRRKGVIGREDQGSPVLAAMIRGILGTGDDVVPPIIICAVRIQWK